MLAEAKNNTVDAATLQAKLDAAEATLDTTVVEPTEPEISGETFTLTTNQDFFIDGVNSTDFNDLYNAYIFDNQNTAQSGDMIDGGTGTDRLEADIGNSQNFAITLDTNSVEQFAVRAQANNNDDDSDNNMNSNVQIDAERMIGTDWYESNNSRADVVIEDVRIERKDAYNDATDQITKDITVAMVSTDPGDVDLDVYFDQASLVKEGDNSANSITLSVSNQVEVSDYDVLNPLKDIPYTDVMFTVNGQNVVLNLDLTSVTTYDEMWTAMQTAFNAEKAINPLLSNVTMTKTDDTDTFFSKDGIARTADEYVLTIDNGTITPATTGWLAEGGLPSTNAFGANVAVGDITTTSNLITSTVVLDNVGRGSMGGDLVIGGLSTGSTSDSMGVEEFDIFVDRDSELQNITSTNNTLQEVYVSNKDHFEDNNTTAAGSLTVTGTVDGVANDDVDGGTNTIDAYGFNDVRVFDASAMVGSVNISAVLSDAVVEKYMELGDTANDGSADNAEFDYILGTNDDTLTLDISNSNLAAAGTTTREDFALSIMGNGGDDTITTMIGTGAGTSADNWYLNSKENANLVIDGGTGEDTITTSGAGDFVINAGADNDTIYADNSGAKAKWVVNANNTDINNLDGTAGDLDGATAGVQSSLFLVNGKLTVALDDYLDTDDAAAAVSGYEVTVDIPTGVNYTVTQLEINQAIKDAINNDDVLKELLVAKDGPSNTLVIESLVDGLTSKDNLEITVASANVNALANYTAAQQALIINAYQAYTSNSSANIAAAQTANAAAVTAVNAAGTFEGIGANNAIYATTSSVAIQMAGAATGDGQVLVTVDGTTYAYTVQGADTLITIAANVAALLTSNGVDASSDGVDTVTVNTANVTATSTDSTATVTAAAAAANIVGTLSAAESDNIINGGTGDDVIVLGTGESSNDTVVFTGNFGDDTIVNFDYENAFGAISGDKLDFTDYLTNVASATGSAGSEVRLDTTGVDGDVNVGTTLGATDTNAVVTFNNFVGDAITGETWANLTGADLVAALEGTVNGADAYGLAANQLDDNSLDFTTIDDSAALTIDDLVGNTQTHIVMIENDANQGEYKVFEIAVDDTAAEITNATLVGTVDFGETVTGSTDLGDNLA